MLRYDLILEDFLTEAFALNHKALIDMIKNRRQVNIYYKGLKDEGGPGWRKIEPYAYGEDHGVKYLRAWLISGASATGVIPGWKFFRCDRIRNVNFASNKVFDKPRPLFNDKGDKHLSKIYALADFNPPKNGKPEKAPKGKPLVPSSSSKTSKKEPVDTKTTKTVSKPSSSLVKGPGAPDDKNQSTIKRMKSLKEMMSEEET